jgi:hypothetical protein
MKEYGIGEIIRPNTRELIDLFEKYFGSSDTWDSRFNRENWNESVNYGNALFRTDEFAPIYRRLLAWAASHMSMSEIYAQAKPSFRIQLKGAKSASFHTDDLSSGHGHNITNFWIPLNNLNSFNCLYLVPKKKSIEILSDIKNNQMSLNDIDASARKSAKPFHLKSGECLCFSNKILHGTVTNESLNVRLSVDFRCLPVGADPGTRILDYEYLKFPEAEDTKLQKIAAISLVYQAGNFSHVGHQAQRQLINDFANRNKYQIIREAMEWHYLDHYPVLHEILTQENPIPLLIFSYYCFDWSSDKGLQLKELLDRYKAPVYFCLENTSISRGARL